MVFGGYSTELYLTFNIFVCLFFFGVGFLGQLGLC